MPHTSLKLGCFASCTSCSRSPSVVVRKAPLCFRRDNANNRSVWLWKTCRSTLHHCVLFSVFELGHSSVRVKVSKNVPSWGDCICHNMHLYASVQEIKGCALRYKRHGHIQIQWLYAKSTTKLLCKECNPPQLILIGSPKGVISYVTLCNMFVTLCNMSLCYPGHFGENQRRTDP